MYFKLNLYVSNPNLYQSIRFIDNFTTGIKIQTLIKKETIRNEGIKNSEKIIFNNLNPFVMYLRGFMGGVPLFLYSIIITKRFTGFDLVLYAILVFIAYSFFIICIYEVFFRLNIFNFINFEVLRAILCVLYLRDPEHEITDQRVLGIPSYIDYKSLVQQVDSYMIPMQNCSEKTETL